MALLGWAIAALGLLAAVGGVLLARRARLEAARARSASAAAEAARVTAEERMRGSFQALPLVALRVDGGGRIIDANRRARERFAFLEEGLGILEAFSEHELAGRVATALESQQADDFEVRLFAEGRRTYRVVIEPYHREGEPEALVSLTDMSEFVAYQELRSQFVANVSHELRTPLTGLRGLLEALDDEDMDAATRVRFVERAAHETERLEALIGDILFLSELEATEGLPSGSLSDLSSAVSITSDELSLLADESGVALEWEAAPDAWTPLNERMARTVVRNLLENAIKYGGAGSRARATVEVVGGNVVLTVADDGSGIPERHLSHVFERFYRADPSRSKRLGGTGLGLSIVKHIAERFGGRATASSREGFGTTITVTLPHSPAPERGVSADGAGTAEPGPQERAPEGAAPAL